MDGLPKGESGMRGQYGVMLRSQIWSNMSWTLSVSVVCMVCCRHKDLWCSQ
jgi:hypothetical protein